MLTDLKAMAIALLTGLVLGAAGAAWTVYSWDAKSYAVKIDKQKIEAATQLQFATNRAIIAERLNEDISHQAEAIHDQAQTVISDNQSLLRRLAVADGMRDPGRRFSGRDAVPPAAAASGVPPQSAPDGRLSDEAQEFLLAEFARADEAAQYAADCRAWAVKVKGAWETRYSLGH